MRSFRKKDVAKSNAVLSMPDLNGPLFFFGRIGSGKSVSLMSTAQLYHDDESKKYKIFDAYGGDRSEQLYWCFPSDENKYWDRAKKLLKLDESGPKQYKVHLLYPMYSSSINKDLPNNPPFVNSSVFTIPIKKIELDDIRLSLGILSQNDEATWRESVEDLRHKDGGAMLLEVSNNAGKRQQIVRNFISPLVKNQLIQNSSCPYNLDVVEEFSDRETISILVMNHIPKEFQLFVLGWICRQINYAIDVGKIKGKNIILMRETAEFFRATENSIMPDRFKVFRAQLSHFIRMGRRGVFFFLDAQSPSETRGLVDGSQNITFLGKMTSEADKEAACAQLKRDNLITTRQVQLLSTLNPGELMFVESGKRVQHRYILMPKTMFWKPGRGDFYSNIWKKYIDKWIATRNIIDQLESDYEKEYKEINVEDVEEQEGTEDKEVIETDNNLEETQEIEKEEKLEDIANVAKIKNAKNNTLTLKEEKEKIKAEKLLQEQREMEIKKEQEEIIRKQQRELALIKRQRMLELKAKQMQK